MNGVYGAFVFRVSEGKSFFIPVISRLYNVQYIVFQGYDIHGNACNIGMAFHLKVTGMSSVITRSLS